MAGVAVVPTPIRSQSIEFRASDRKAAIIRSDRPENRVNRSQYGCRERQITFGRSLGHVKP
jgi:hypothetical protein